MPRFVVERTFPDGVRIPVDAVGARFCASVVANNAREGVTWIHSYVSEDFRKTYCIYDGPDEEAIRRASARSDLPVDAVRPVRVLDPYFYLSRD